ncbi:MAG: hypothetical protein AAF268_07780 [Cyanobacteria bacterium P01_A01_bin.3]
MERGLLWLPLLGTFITLTWLGWRSYRQVESYRTWSQDFDTAKYDAAAVAGLKNRVVTWGQPSSDGPINLQTINLDRVDRVELLVNNTELAWPPQELPTGKTFAVALYTLDSEAATHVPFSDVKLAIAWCHKLKQLAQ